MISVDGAPAASLASDPDAWWDADAGVWRDGEFWCGGLQGTLRRVRRRVR